MRALVTGGGGFLGRAIVARLQARGATVVSLARGDYPELAAQGVTVRRGDIGRLDDVLAAARGCDVVFHAAAKAGVWGPEREYHRVNALGTANVLEACRRQGVGRLVFTSSPSVVFDGRDEHGIDERAPYPSRYLAAYPRTKAAAERLVLAADDPRLRTVALRPHLIWGPGDPHLVPRILERARRGRLRLIGAGQNLVDSTYIDNAADAHLLAAARLEDSAQVAGRAFFISNAEPLPMADLINRILAAGGLAPVSAHLPAPLAYAVGGLLEALHGALARSREPLLTRFVARQLATAHWFDIGAARRELGYRPAVTIAQGMERLRAALHASTEPAGMDGAALP